MINYRWVRFSHFLSSLFRSHSIRYACAFDGTSICSCHFQLQLKPIINHNNFDGIGNLSAPLNSWLKSNQMPSKNIRKNRRRKNAHKTEQLSFRRRYRRLTNKIKWFQIPLCSHAEWDRCLCFAAPAAPRQTFQTVKNSFHLRISGKMKLIAMNSECSGRSVVSVSTRCVCVCVCVANSS